MCNVLTKAAVHTGDGTVIVSAMKNGLMLNCRYQAQHYLKKQVYSEI